MAEDRRQMLQSRSLRANYSDLRPGVHQNLNNSGRLPQHQYNFQDLVVTMPPPYIPVDRPEVQLDQSAFLNGWNEDFTDETRQPLFSDLLCQGNKEWDRNLETAYSCQPMFDFSSTLNNRVDSSGQLESACSGIAVRRNTYDLANTVSSGLEAKRSRPRSPSLNKEEDEETKRQCRMERRRESNRKSARRCREKEKQKKEQMEDEINSLKMQNVQLHRLLTEHVQRNNELEDRIRYLERLTQSIMAPQGGQHDDLFDGHGQDLNYSASLSYQ
eukprot:g8324.t1